MTTQELSAKTVIELRKIAKENAIPLGAKINKAEIVERIAQCLSEKEAESVQTSLFDAMAEPSAPVSFVTEDKEDPGFDNGEDALYIASKEQESDAELPETSAPVIIHAASPLARTPLARTPEKTVFSARPVYSQGFGPAIRAQAKEETAPETASPQPAAPAAPAAAAGQPQFRAVWHNPAPNPNTRQSGETKTGFGPRSSWTAGRVQDIASATRTSSTSAPRFGPEMSHAGQGAETRPSYTDTARSRGFGPVHRSESGTAKEPPVASWTSDTIRPGVESAPRRDSNETPSLNDLLINVTLEEGQGTLDIHSDGYGFLRTESLTPSNRDIYLSSAVIRRYSLRNGDFVTGKLRPPRDGDKYKAMLTVDSINGTPSGELTARSSFDELTPVYTTRRLSLDHPDYTDIRLMDLITPMGYGQRALMLFPPDARKPEFLCHLAEAIRKLHPDTEVMMLLVGKLPEDITLYREMTGCSIVSASLEQTPESQMRLMDLMLEKCMRMVECKKDVIFIVDSLMRMCRLQPTAAQSPSPRPTTSISPVSLFRAKRIFSAGRCLREGGSLTVIAAMDVESGNKVDESTVEDFRENATLLLTFDPALQRAGVYPPISFEQSRTSRPDLLLTPQEQEGISTIRSMQKGASASQAASELLSMVEHVKNNADMLRRMKDWAQLMAAGRKV